MQARKLPPRQGMVWVVAGYQLFRANPALLSVLTFGYLMVLTFMLVLPGGLGSMLLPLLQPMLILVVANGCRSIARRGVRKAPPDLLVGVGKRRPELIKLGGLQLAGSVLVLLILYAFDVKPDPQDVEQFLQVMAITAALSLPLLMAFWFAPLLTGWHDVPPLKSVFFSIVAALRNWRAFAVYALTLTAIALVPAMLAVFAAQVSDTFGDVLAKVVEVLFVLLVLPIFLTGNYVSYRDIFSPDET